MAQYSTRRFHSHSTHCVVYQTEFDETRYSLGVFSRVILDILSISEDIPRKSRRHDGILRLDQRHSENILKHSLTTFWQALSVFVTIVMSFSSSL